MVTSIINPRTQKLYCLWGYAGIGKIRIIHEVSAKIKDSLFYYFECLVKHDNLNVVEGAVKKHSSKKEGLKSRK